MGPRKETALERAFVALAEQLKEATGKSTADIVALLQTDSIPATAFACGLTPLETVAHYARGSSKQLAETLGRTTANIRALKKSAQKKGPADPQPTDFFLPVRIFAAELSTLEAACWHLRHEEDLRNNEIAMLIDRDERVVATLLSRAEKKRGDAHE